MKISSKFETAVSRQINIEWNLSYSYLAIAGWFETTPYKGFARWMQRQCIEEQDHAMRLYRYIKDRIGVVNLFSIKEPVRTFKTPLDAFEAALAMERRGTANIYELYSLA